MLDRGARAARNVIVPIVTSRHHAFVSRCRAIARRRTDASEILIDGVHLLGEAMAAGVPVETAAFTAAARASSDGSNLAGRLEAAGAQVLTVSDAVMNALSPVRTPTGVVAVGRHEPAALERVFRRQPALVVGIVAVQDPGNVGAIIRAAAAAGATGVVAAEGSADPFGWKALRGAMGSAFRIPVAAGVSLAALLEASRGAGVIRFAAVPAGGVDLFHCDLASPALILVGNEGAGLDAATLAASDVRVRIPMADDVESLNVAVATGVILFEALRQRAGRITGHQS